ncbi:MAG: hypothetical protein IKA12_02320 [Clostridia bacterium]|nr:hypothetical protein [Clostridia bacterium]
MQDFNDYVNNQGNSSDLFGIVNDLAKKFDGKGQGELLKAIYQKAKEGKANGTLSNAEIDGFANMLNPLLDDKQKRTLKKVIEELKKI